MIHGLTYVRGCRRIGLGGNNFPMLMPSSDLASHKLRGMIWEQKCFQYSPIRSKSYLNFQKKFLGVTFRTPFNCDSAARLSGRGRKGREWKEEGKGGMGRMGNYLQQQIKNDQGPDIMIYGQFAFA